MTKLKSNNHSRTSSLTLKQDYEILTSGNRPSGSNFNSSNLLLQESLGEIRDAVLEMEDRVTKIQNVSPRPDDLQEVKLNELIQGQDQKVSARLAKLEKMILLSLTFHEDTAQDVIFLIEQAPEQTPSHENNELLSMKMTALGTTARSLKLLNGGKVSEIVNRFR